MSDLEQLRDHARFMADREHGVNCPPQRARPTKTHDHRGEKWCGDTGAHDEHTWTGPSRFGSAFYPEWTCLGICAGCLPDNERRLWAQIADEIDVYLTPPDDGPDLFGGSE